MPSHFRLFLETTNATADLVAFLRHHVNRPISELREAIATQQPIIDESPHHNRYSEFIASTTGLRDQLDGRGIRYAIEVDGKSKSRC